MSRVQWIEHKGKKILFNNEKDLDEKEIFENLDALINEMKAFTGKTLLVLTDITNTCSTKEIYEKSKELVTISKAKKIDIISSVVGIYGMKKMIASVLKRDIHFSDTIEDACDWLVEQT